jgi:hypothetical protein
MSGVILLGGCSSDPREVTGTAPSDDAVIATCKALMSELPDTVAGQRTVDLSNGEGWAAAWGEPAIVLRCGVPTPEALTATSQCLTVNDIGWFATQNGAAADLTNPTDATVDFTTVDRSVNVEVSVPSKWSPPSDALVDLSSAIAAATEETTLCQ